jgi:hypothetical protein
MEMKPNLTTKENTTIEGAFYTGVHHYTFRPGKPALITGVKILTPFGKEPRLCYEVTYPDGVIDYKAITGDLTYKLHNADGEKIS